MNDVRLNWKKINKTLSSVRRYALDRAPTIEELRALVRYPEMRVEITAFVMVSSGIHVGAWDYLTIKNVQAIERDGKVMAAKLIVYEAEVEEYTTFITPEAYDSIQRILGRVGLWGRLPYASTIA